MFCKALLDQDSNVLYIIGVRNYRTKIQAVTVLRNGIVQPTSNGTIFSDFFVWNVSYAPQDYTVIIISYSTAKITITCDGNASLDLYVKDGDVYHPIINGDEVKINSTILYKAVASDLSCVIEVNGKQQEQTEGEITITKDTEFFVSAH